MINKIIILLFCFSSSVFSSDKIDLNFQQIKLSEALTIYADYTHTNLIIDSSIDEVVDLRLHKISPENLLNVLVSMYDLVVVKEKGASIVMKRVIYETRHQSMKSYVYHVKNLSAETLYKTLNSRSRSSNKNKNRIKQRLSFHKSTNSIVIRGTQYYIDNILSIINKLDIIQSQVIIKAKLVSMSDTDLKKLGVVLDSSVNIGDSTLSSALNLATTATSSYSFLISKASKFSLDLKILAMQEQGTSKIISEPKIFTTNNVLASISQGTQIPYQVQGQNGAFHNEFKDAVLSLSVTPRVFKDDIFLSIRITKDSPIFKSNVVLINTRSIDSNIRIKSGQTVVLGGIKDIEKSNNINTVPYLSDIPYLGGWLFTSTSNNISNRNLVVFITPIIINN